MSNTTRKATIIILLTFIGLLIGWDFYAAFGGAQKATISEVTLSFFYAHPMAALAMGSLLGHLTWPVRNDRPRWLTGVLVGGSALAMLLVDLLAHPPAMVPVTPLVLGIGWGHLIWPQPVTSEGSTIVPPGALGQKTPATPGPQNPPTPMPPSNVRM